MERENKESSTFGIYPLRAVNILKIASSFSFVASLQHVREPQDDRIKAVLHKMLLFNGKGSGNYAFQSAF